MQKKKKVIYKNKSLVATVALIVAVFALLLALMYGVSKSKKVEAKEPEGNDNAYEEVVSMIDALKARLSDTDKKNALLTKELDLQYQHLTETTENNYKKLIKDSDGKYVEITKELTKEMESKNQKITELEKQLTELKESINTLTEKVGNVDTYYPIGSLYLSLSDRNPAELFGGKWELIAAGQNLMGAGNASYPLGSSGGNYELVLEQENLPNYDLIVNDPGHSHDITDPGHVHGYTTVAGIDNADRYPSFSAVTGTSGANTTKSQTGITIDGATTGISVNSGGAGKAVSLLSPYLVVNIWKRIA